MTGRKHDAVFDDVLSGLDGSAAPTPAPAGGARFLRRSTAIGEQLSGEREEKVLHWVDPALCRMWPRHNREYSLLNEENCRDLIDGIRAQGQQEFPAIARRLPEGDVHRYEVICGARRHFAVSWLRANNYPQFRYLVEVRDLTDEEAFRLADIENRDREDISDYERARDYAEAIDLYYGGRQKAMAERLEVSEPWLSRYLALARLPHQVVDAFASIRDLRELHARTLKPLLASDEGRKAVLREAAILARAQEAARKGQGAPIEAPDVVARLKAAANAVVARKPKTRPASNGHDKPFVAVRRSGRRTILEIPDALSRPEVEAALATFVKDRFRCE